jgi:hypothetical protein
MLTPTVYQGTIRTGPHTSIHPYAFKLWRLEVKRRDYSEQWSLLKRQSKLDGIGKGSKIYDHLHSELTPCVTLLTPMNRFPFRQQDCPYHIE